MKHLTFFLFVYMLTALVYAGPEDRWVPAESVNTSAESVQAQSVDYTGIQFDGIALVLGIAAFAWVYIIYRDFKTVKKKSRR